MRASADTLLASGDIRILGVTLQIVLPPGDGVQQVPRNTAYLLPTRVLRSSTDVSADFTTYRVRGVLNGPGLDVGGAEVVTIPGQPLEIGTQQMLDSPIIPSPPLRVTGNYVLSDLRLTDAGGATIVAADPAVVSIHVPEKVIVSEVRTRPLSLEEIQERGIVIGSENFTAFSFSFGLATQSQQVPISLDVVFPQDEEVLPGGGNTGLPLVVPGLDVPNLDVQGILLDTPLDFDGQKLPPIPGIIVIPGNVAFLNQFLPRNARCPTPAAGLHATPRAVVGVGTVW